MADNFDLREEMSVMQDPSSYDIPLEREIMSGDGNDYLERAVQSVAESSENITESEVFNVFRTFLKNSASVHGGTMNKIHDSICSGFSQQSERALDAVNSNADASTLQGYRAVLEMYGFLLTWFFQCAETFKSSDEDGAPAPRAKRGRGAKSMAARSMGRKESWSRDVYVRPTLMLLERVLRVKTQRIWTTATERDAFIECLLRPAYSILESESLMKVETNRTLTYKIICVAVKHHNHALSIGARLDQALSMNEHLSEPVADLLTLMVTGYDHSQVADEMLRSIAGKSFNAQETKTPRSIAKFLVSFAERCPDIVLKKMSLLLTHLDSESYPLRQAMVEIMGFIIKDLEGKLRTATSSTSEDSNLDSKSMQKQIIGLYDLLRERTGDLNTYVRARVYQVFSRLLDLELKFPKQRLAITTSAISALEDKAATVRKAAISLLTKLMLTHPFGIHGGHLELSEWQVKYDEIVNELRAIEKNVNQVMGTTEDETQETEPGDTSSADKMDVDDDDDDDDDEEVLTQAEDDEDHEGDGENAGARSKKKKRHQRRKSEIDLAALNDADGALAQLDNAKIAQLKLLKKMHAEAMYFIRQIEGAMDMMGDLLGSKSKPEVLEAIEFFRVAHEYRFTQAEVGIRKMLHLIWQKDVNATSEDGTAIKGVRQGLLECYNSLYFEPIAGLEPRAQVNRVAKNMIELTYEASLAELTSLEEMLRTMMLDNRIHIDVINKLWVVYSSDKQLPKEQRRGAIMILGMLALAKRGVVTDHVDTLLKVGCGYLGKSDLVLAKYSCLALQRLNGSAKNIKGSLENASMRIDSDSPIFRRLQEMVMYPSRSKEWFPLAEQIINTIYALADRPDALCDAIIKDLTRRAFQRGATSAVPQSGDPDAMDEDEIRQPTSTMSSSQNATHSQGGKDIGDSFTLSQMIFVVGHVAIKHIAYLELVEREWKRQKDIKDAEEKRLAGHSRASTKQDGEELDQVAGNAEDEIGERIAGVRETELLFGEESLLAMYGPMIVQICGSPQKYKNNTLRAAAILAFSKFLCVSSKFCEAHLMLLFRIFDTSKSASVRSNIVIALGDVAVSFSTLVDENSNELYKGLSDSDLIVKKNTLMVLTHLILNGMIKVKGQLGELAKCLEDEDRRIADLSKMFFSQLSTKDNAIYNNLPDVISHLSFGDHAVEEEVFQSTMKYIFTFIEKEKQAESIVEKLCQRFRLSEGPRQWRDIAFCLSLLPYKSERSMKKLIEGLPNYRDKLHEPDVFDRFSEILTKARSNKAANKPDAELNEFEQILEEHQRQGQDDQELEKRIMGKKAAAKRKATKRSARKRTRAQTPEDDDE